MTDPSGIPTAEGARRDAARAPSTSLTPEEREELQADLEVLREQRREYAFPGRLPVDGGRNDRERIRGVLDRAIAYTEELLG
jgi:hypothetical protein